MTAEEKGAVITLETNHTNGDRRDKERKGRGKLDSRTS